MAPVCGGQLYIKKLAQNSNGVYASVCSLAELPVSIENVRIAIVHIFIKSSYFVHEKYG